MKRQPTKTEQRQERIVILSAGVDTATTGVVLLAAVSTASLSLLGESLRLAFLVALQLYAVFVLRSLHRGRFSRFDYGIGKLEQTVWIALAVSLLFGSFWMVDRIFQVASGLREPAGPLGLAIAALANAVSLLICDVGRRVMRQHLPTAGPPVFEAHLKLRDTMFLGSVGLQCTMTAAALVRDAELALAFDILGAAFLTILMFGRGLLVLARSLPDLLDAPAPEDKQWRIAQIARSLLPPGEAVDIRTRRNGAAVEVEIAVAGTACRTAGDLCRCATDIENALCAEGFDADVGVILSRFEGTRAARPVHEQ